MFASATDADRRQTRDSSRSPTTPASAPSPRAAGCSFDVTFAPTATSAASAAVQFSGTPAIADYAVLRHRPEGKPDSADRHFTFQLAGRRDQPRRSRRPSPKTTATPDLTVDRFSFPPACSRERLRDARPASTRAGRQVSVTFTPDTLPARRPPARWSSARRGARAGAARRDARRYRARRPPWPSTPGTPRPSQRGRTAKPVEAVIDHQQRRRAGR